MNTVSQRPDGTEVMAFANSKAWWKCRTCGYEWNTLISTRSGGSKLMNDIVLNNGAFDENGNWSESGTPNKWTPIGDKNHRYSGTFDGGGHIIKGLYVTGAEKAGLFGSISNAAIKNVTVDGFVEGTEHVGGIVGYISSPHIENCVNLCHVATTAMSAVAGGIAGFGDTGKILSCANLGTVSASPGDDQPAYTGGIVGGASDTTVADCYNAGKVMSLGGRSEDSIGGIVGAAATSKITNCYNVGRVSKESVSPRCRIGGIAGYQSNRGTISNCYWLSDTADAVVGKSDGGTQTDVAIRTKSDFADGTVLNLLKNGHTDSPWEKCGYLNAAGMVVPLLKGQAADTFPIYTAENLKAFRDMVNSGESGANAKLMNDIDLGGEQWTPIGNYTGRFDGNGKTISGLSVTGVTNAGLFDTLSGGAVVKNLTVAGSVEAFNTDGGAYAGAIAAYATGSTTITGCKNYATVTTTTVAGKDVSVTYAAYAGGTVGYAANSVILTDCVNNGTVLSTIRNNDDFSVKAYIGGIAGTADGNIRFGNCVNNGALSTDCKSAESNIGGIVGCAIGGAVIADCQNNGAVTGAVDHSEDPDIYYMYYTTGSNVGGIVGYGVAIRITGCCSAGAIRSDSTGNYVGSTHIGGIAGYIISGVEEAVITDCSNVATVTGTNSSLRVLAGGIVGFVNTDRADVSFTNCYSTGAVSAVSPTSKIVIGGIAGEILPSDNGDDIVIDDCCWLTDTVETAVGFNHKGLPVNASSKSAAQFADGTVLDLLKNNRTDSPWAKTDYLAAAGFTLPLLNWQTADSHTHSEKTGNCLDGIYCECGHLMHGAESEHNWSSWQHLTTSHTRNCNNPGCGITQIRNCSGGTATCTEQAVCEVCGEHYGALDSNNHSYEWQNENGFYWQHCRACGADTKKTAVPQIIINAPDKVCRAQDFKFSFTLPENITDVHYGYEFIGLGDSGLAPDFENGVFSGAIKAAAYPSAENRFKLVVHATTPEGFYFTAEKTVDILDEHIGGKATCIERAICEICGESYGELDPDNHSDLQHFAAKSATETEEGNIEYWYCSGCGKYFLDFSCEKEISKADTVTAKLEKKKTENKDTAPKADKSTKSPDTGNDYHLVAWCALLFAGSILCIIILKRKKNITDNI